MWYYAKDNQTYGPYADSALKRFYELGRIDEDTKIWFKGDEEWVELSKSNRFGKLFTRKYLRLSSYTSTTRKFRGFLLTFALANIVTLFFDYKHLLLYENILNIGGEPTDFLKIYAREYAKVSSTYSVILFVLMLFLFRTMFNWMLFSLRNVQLFDKGFRLSPTFYSYSYFIPIANFFMPYYAIWKTFRISKICVGRRMNIFDANYIILFWFFNIFTICVMLTYIFLHTGAYDMGVERGFILFKAYVSLLIAFSCFLWFLIVTKIHNVQAITLRKFE